MLAASAEGLDLARLLLDLLTIVVAAKAAAELFERFGLPAVLGEIVAGITIGPSALGLVELTGDRGVTIAFIAEIGVLLLLVQVGMEMDLTELGKVGRASMLVGIIGVAIPFAGGALTGLALGESGNTSLFLGAALSATSVGITARVFGDLKALATTEARIVLGAAVADDVLGLVILTVVVKMVTGGGFSVSSAASTLGVAVGFIVVAGAVALLILPRAIDGIGDKAQSAATLTVAALAAVLVFSSVADTAKLAFIIGAFVAGLGLGRSNAVQRIEHDMASIGAVFVPVFFAQIGINTDLGVLGDPKVLGIAAALTVVGVAGKLLAAAGSAGTPADRWLIGLGMVPRGEVGLIFASIGLANGVLDDDLYGALIIVVLVTTVITPPLLRLRLTGDAARDLQDTAAVPTTSEPPGGWISVIDGELRLEGNPPTSSIVPLALHVAELAVEARPSPGLLQWFADRRAANLVWTNADTRALVQVLRFGSPRSLRFLDLIGVLERALPEVAALLTRRRADAAELEPSRVLRLPTLSRLNTLLAGGGVDSQIHRESERLGPSDALVLAALAADVCQPDEVAGFCERMWVDDSVARAVTDAHLLRAASREVTGSDRAEVRQLAAHFGDRSSAGRAYLLAAAMEESPSGWRRDALDSLFDLVSRELDHVAETRPGSGSADQLSPSANGDVAVADLAVVHRGAAEALVEHPSEVERLRAAPVACLLAHEPDELARQARLIEPLPSSGTVRVAVSPDPAPDHWVVDIACRDIPDLLGRAGADVNALGADVVNATLASWPDGAAMCTLLVRSTQRPGARQLALALEARLHRPLTPQPIYHLEIAFDNTSLPWHTVCAVGGADRRGVLQALAAAFSSAGLVVHSARVQTADSAVADRFALTDRSGRKLDDAAMVRLRQALASAPRRPRFRSRRAHA